MAHLFATSEQTSFAGFAEETQVPIANIVERGGRWDHHRIVFDLPDANWDDLEVQIHHAVSFLERWESEMAAFVAVLKPDEFCLGFVVVSRLDEVLVQNDYLSPRLIALAGKLGLGIQISSQSKASISDL